MPTILIKGLHDDTLKRLKRLKVELECATWAELLEKLTEPGQEGSKILSFERKDLKEMKRGVRAFLALRGEVSKKWSAGPPSTVLAEIRKSRRHESPRS